jgi:hypothetical protein
LCQKYVYDFLGDSSEDVGEMMKTLWNGLALLIACSKKEIAISYSVGGQAVGDPVALLNDAIKTHYEGFDGGAKTLTDKLSTWDEKTLQNAVDAIHKLVKPSAKVKAAPKKAADSGDEKLNQLIGLEPVKNTIKMVEAYVAKNQGKPVDIHMTLKAILAPVKRKLPVLSPKSFSKQEPCRRTNSWKQAGVIWSVSISVRRLRRQETLLSRRWAEFCLSTKPMNSPMRKIQEISVVKPSQNC